MNKSIDHYHSEVRRPADGEALGYPLMRRRLGLFLSPTADDLGGEERLDNFSRPTAAHAGFAHRRESERGHLFGRDGSGRLFILMANSLGVEMGNKRRPARGSPLPRADLLTRSPH